jgi:hypothetical protein
MEMRLEQPEQITMTPDNQQPAPEETPLSDYPDAELIQLAFEKYVCYGMYGGEALADRVQECRDELLLRMCPAVREPAPTTPSKEAVALCDELFTSIVGLRVEVIPTKSDFALGSIELRGDIKSPFLTIITRHLAAATKELYTELTLAHSVISDDTKQIVALRARVGELEKELTTKYDGNNLPRVNIICETKADGIIGTTTLNVIRVEIEDDGSFTAITDYWPNDARIATLEGQLAEANKTIDRAIADRDASDRIKNDFKAQLATAKRDGERLREVGKELLRLWDLRDGHLVSHFGTSVERKVEAFRAAMQQEGNR